VPLELALGGSATLYPDYAQRMRDAAAPASARRAPPTAEPHVAAAGVSSLHVAGQVWLVAAGGRNVAVQIGSEGVLVVNAGPAESAAAVLAEIRKLAPEQRIRVLVATNDAPTHIGANAALAAGPTPRAQRAAIVAHESSSLRMASAAVPDGGAPTDTFYRGTRELYFNGEPIEIIHVPEATSDGDVLVFFRTSDVVVAGDVVEDLTYPIIRLRDGGTVDGTIAALNRILDITIAAWRAQGGTSVIPSQGRIYDEADVAEYRDMLTIVRDRIADAIDKGLTLEAVLESRIARDYDGRYGAAAGPASPREFVTTVYEDLSADRAQRP
jgi:glyoxylase-like metal-dependent hydrolase (beta-lactamase superfamily II)